MKRMHIHLGVQDLDASVRFYSALFAAEPTVLKTDYAKWILEDPRVNFAIATHARSTGVDHLGIQAGDESELAEIQARLRDAGGPVLDEGTTTCCYAHSTKQWTADPQGVDWEAFLTHGESVTYGHKPEMPEQEAEGACCR